MYVIVPTSTSVSDQIAAPIPVIDPGGTPIPELVPVPVSITDPGGFLPTVPIPGTNSHLAHLLSGSSVITPPPAKYYPAINACQKM